MNKLGSSQSESQSFIYAPFVTSIVVLFEVYRYGGDNDGHISYSRASMKTFVVHQIPFEGRRSFVDFGELDRHAAHECVWFS